MTQTSNAHTRIFSPDPEAAVVRYQVRDVDRSARFYTEHLGFRLTNKAGPVTIVSRGALHLILGGPASSGARAMPDGADQSSGGWNRIVLYVEHITELIAALKTANVHFRNTLEVGPGGKQILVDDPDGNPIELHEGPRAST